MSAKNAKKERLFDQLSDPLDWDISQLEFGEITEETIPDENVKACVVYLYNRNKDGTRGRLMFEFDKSSSLGISTKYGLSFGLRLWDMEPTERQKRTLEVIEQVIERVKKYVIANKKELKRPKLQIDDRSEFKHLTQMLKYKEDEDGNRDNDAAPLFPLKLLSNKNKETGKQEIRTVFTVEDEVDENGNALDMDYEELIDKRCYARCAVRLHAIFVSQSSITLRRYLVEADVKVIESNQGPKRFLRKTLTKISTSGGNDLTKRVEEPVEEEEDEETSSSSSPPREEGSTSSSLYIPREEPKDEEPVTNVKKPIAKKKAK